MFVEKCDFHQRGMTSTSPSITTAIGEASAIATMGRNHHERPSCAFILDIRHRRSFAVPEIGVLDKENVENGS